MLGSDALKAAYGTQKYEDLALCSSKAARLLSHRCAAAAGFILFSWLVFKRLDYLPEQVQTFLHTLLRHDHHVKSAIYTGVPLSKHLAYRLDTW